ncbi:cell wall metabolism sensor histidine kinase WalK [bacterium]|nr:cell wall metabolism sensor histidine kinase WalK [bacterium]
MQREIRWRIILPYLILLILSVTVFTLLVTNHIRQQETERWQDQSLDSAQVIALAASDLFNQQGERALLSQLALQTSDIYGYDVTFLNFQGEVLGSSLSLEQQPHEPLRMLGVSQAISEGAGAGVADQTLGVAVLVVGPEGNSAGLVQLQIPLAYYELNLNRITWLSVAVILVGMAAFVLITLFVNDLSRKPIETLTIVAQQMSGGNFKNLEFPAAPQELSALTDALREMADQLGAQIDALTSERAKLSAVLNQMTDGVMIVDVDGRVQLINPASERLFEMRESTALGRSIVEVVRYHQLVNLWRRAKAGKRESITLEIGPQHLFLQVVAIPLKTALPGSTMILFQDLTQLRRLETVRRDFISNVSHELRTPLASVRALAETLQEGALEDPPAARRFIIRMETEIDNLTQLVNELLELSRIESGKVPLSFHRIQPCDLLAPATERMSLQAERAGLELVLDCDAELPQVFADPDRIAQVLINLIHNAIKFTPPGGKLTVSSYQDGDHIVFFVRDTGVGIARKDLSRIFERFYKADRARAGGGTGLGLSIARHMIESHGGYIWAESDEGVGSTFYFTLPVA